MAAETCAAQDLRTSHQGTESCNKRTQRRSCTERTQQRSCTKRTQRRSCNKRTQRRPAGPSGTSGDQPARAVERGEECDKSTQRRAVLRGERARSCRRARRPGALRKLSARETTGGATEAVVACEAALGPAGGARPVAQAAVQAEHQPVRVTSALKKGPRATSAGLAETSRWSETSGASFRTSQTPAGPRGKRAQERT